VKIRPALPRPISSPDESPIFRALAKPTTVEFLDLPLEDCLTFLKEYHNISIRADAAALAKAKIQLDSPVMLKLNGAPLQGTLDMLLGPLGLDTYVDGSELIVSAADWGRFWNTRSRLSTTSANSPVHRSRNCRSRAGATSSGCSRASQNAE
jgi:hypothetical protein